ncbi:2Fe-2S iron-sulfur cluster-binding protein [Amycolatopsis acidiphila]|uniref:2Fe-2S iron-sulfur cluster binding domain-containing protein n=1 Tax=Amycolatopsis acidiphila TaxID=715473 RepID=A0A558AB69_9PSEU|nr:2Fe-2S iron-sulfur cluster-binding protein [Amycolatopsis acidiphila]TVT21493.1 2Fe-2S iron-sulfur cluster binding domain-containing protein [Amycolatopsis acidiphila]UIJ63178.1 2Fe-2S iron-sulfur cluster-binding protein [Amycolatopsis acidiphila]GHG74207.1 ferredoxin [Amycolatopsis acidiphila]
MPKVTYHRSAGDPDVLDVPAGTNLMRAAVTGGVRGTVGECGGQAMCATCYVYVREPYLGRLPEIGEDEEELLECTAAPRDDRRSRLGCRLTLGDGLEEIEVDLPASQV